MKINLRVLWKIILSCFAISLINQNLFAQSPCPNSNCVSGDIRITEVKLVQNNAPTYSNLPNACNPNQLNVPVALKVTFDVTSQTRYGFIVVADIWITDPNSANPTTPYKAGRIAKCYTDTFSQGLQVKYIAAYMTGASILWPCPSTIQLRDVYTAWDNQVTTASHPSICTYLNESTGTISTQSCKTITPKCKFYGSNESINVISPLIVNYTYSGSCPAGNTVQRISFTNTTTGGVIPYSSLWDFGDGTATSTATSPTHDYAAPGNYTVRLTVTDNSLPLPHQTFYSEQTVTVASCCSQSSFQTQPTAVSQCTGTAASFTIAATGGNPAPTIQWQEKVGNGNFTNLANGGVYSNVTTSTLNISNIAGLNTNQYRAVLTNGPCTPVNSNAVTLTVYPKPTAGISGTTTVCKDATSPNIQFTGSGGTAPYTFNYTLNGTPLTVTTSSGNSVNVTASTGTATTLTYVLTGVSDANCSNTASGTATVTVYPKPSGGISGSTTVCKDLSSPSIQFTGNGGTAPYTFNYTLNGTPLTATTSVGNSVNVAAPTGTATTLTYVLTGVSDANCSNTASGTAIVVINAKPSAGISGTTAVCKDATQPNVTFTGSGGTTPYTFNYTLNGSPATISTTGANTSVTLAASTANATTLTYALTGVSDANCSNTASGSAVVTVNAPPNAPGVNVTQPTCGNANGTVTVTSPLDDGTIDYEYKNGAGNYTDNVAFSVAANTGYSIVVRNKGTGCVSSATTGTMGSQGSAPAQPSVSVKTPASCSSSSITLEVTAPTGAYEYRNNNGNWQTSKEFVIHAGDGYSIQARSTTDVTCISTAATCAGESSRSSIVQQAEKTAVINIPGEETSVKAYPNPFSDKINFVVTNAETRKGTLEVYNLSGQRLATVYNGIIPAGTQVFELRMPVRQVAELVYVLNMGNKKVTGKVLQVR